MPCRWTPDSESQRSFCISDWIASTHQTPDVLTPKLLLPPSSPSHLTGNSIFFWHAEVVCNVFHTPPQPFPKRSAVPSQFPTPDLLTSFTEPPWSGHCPQVSGCHCSRWSPCCTCHPARNPLLLQHRGQDVPLNLFPVPALPPWNNRNKKQTHLAEPTKKAPDTRDLRKQ